jgi:hypothetical protein
VEDEPQLVEEVEALEEVEPPSPCPVCDSELTEGKAKTECDWCGLQFHEDCEPQMERCPGCKRYLPSAKKKALSADRRNTAVLVIVPFVVIEMIIAIYSWMTHPSAISVPDIGNWLSMGLIVNVILLALALVSMGGVARRGEGVKKKKDPREDKSEDESQD